MQVVPLAMHTSGTCEFEGYVPFILDENRKIQCFAIYDGNNTGNDQRRCPTPEETMAYYESCLPKYPGSDDPVKQLVRVVPSTAEAVDNNQLNSLQEESHD